MAVRHRPKPLPPRFRLAGALTAHAHYLVALARGFSLQAPGAVGTRPARRRPCAP